MLRNSRLLLCRSHNVRNTPLLFTSTKPAVKQSEDSQLKEYEKLSKFVAKAIKKKPQRAPFVKNMFVGVFDNDLLAYPEVLDKEQTNRLELEIKTVEHFADTLDSNTPGMSSEFVATARQLNLFGLQVPQLSGGRDLNLTELCRFGEVIMGRSGDCNLINNETLGVQIMLKAATEKQQGKYLEALSSGNVISAMCLQEAETSDLRILKTSATQDGNNWILNGEKCFVINGDSANLLFVVANTEAINKLGLKESKATMFLVERTFGGVTSKSTKLLGLHQTDISTVKFENVKVPNENIIGELHKADEVLVKILNNYRLSAAPSCVALSKTALKKFIEYCKRVSDDEVNNLLEVELVKGKIADIALNIYAMESMMYFTAALTDEYENQDVELECAITKAFSSEHCHSSTLKCLNFLGAASYDPNHWCNELHRNSLSYLSLSEPLDLLKITIALQGLRHAGLSIQDEIKKIRNPMFYAGAVFKRMWTHRNHMTGNPKLTLHLSSYLHPSAMMAANLLEYCVLRLQFVTETVLARHGSDVVQKHLDLLRIADSIIDIYAMTASLSRASRSYCIGLQYSDYEMLIAIAFCIKASDRVKDNLEKAVVGPHQTNDVNCVRIGEKLFKVGEYYPEHALKKNF